MRRLAAFLALGTLVVLTACGGGSGSGSGGLCGVPGLEGQREARISGRLPGCGISNPVTVTRVAGVNLTAPATLDCETARALNSWVERTAKPAIGKTGGGLVSMRVINHYSCRTVNSRPGGSVSEHGKGKAIDIAAFGLRDGSSISVLGDWRGGGVRERLLRQMHGRACGTFSTVLGPDADRYHQDHIHLDTRDGGDYCR